MKHGTGVIRQNWDQMEKEALSDVIERKMIWGDRLMLSHIILKKGSVVPLHKHENEQFSYILKGSMRFWLEREGGDEIEVHEGDVLQIPANVPHGAITLEDTLSLDVFSPPRQDWIEKTDDYLRKGE